MFLLNNNPLQVGVAFTHDDLQYPANWLQLSTAEEKAEIGITEVDDPTTYDDRYYWSVGNPKDLDVIKANLISQIKATANSLLVPTDWKVIRAAETKSDVASDVLTARAAIRTASNANEAAVTACVTMFEIESLQLTWPEL
jgi:hypothetical protein